jgi:PAS domain S-box-containing protein
MYFNIYAIPVLIAALVMLVLAMATRKYRATPGVNCFALLLLAGTLYSLFYALEISSGDIKLVETFYRLEYIGIPFIPAFYLLFAIRYSGRKEKLKTHHIIAVLAIPLATIIMVFTNSHHNLFISGGQIDDSGLYPAYAFTPGIWYWVHQAYSILTIIISSILFVFMLMKSAPAFRKQVSIILIASLVPFISYLIYLAGKFPWGLDPIPFAFSVTGLIAYIGISRFKLFNLAPLARNLLFDKIPDAVLVYDEKSRFLDCNEAANKLLNIKPRDLGSPIVEVLVNFPALVSFLDSAKACESPVVSLKINKQPLFFNCFCSPIVDNNKRIRGKILIMHDITNQHITELQRREIEEKFRLIFENVPIGVFYYDKSGIIKVCNDHFVSIIGSTREKILGLNTLQLADQRVVSAIQNSLQGKKGLFEGEYHSVTATKITSVSALFDAIRNANGEIEGGFGIIQDITERKKAEEKIKIHNLELQQLNAEKDRFFSIIAHDLRSPFNAFLGFTELMTDDNDEATIGEMKTYAGEIRKSALILFGLLENLLEWSRLQQKSIQMQPQALLLNEIVNQTISIFYEASAKKAITLIHNIDKSVRVLADENMLSSVFRNIVSNAIKFTKRGGRVTINAETLENGMIEVQISDNGIGIQESTIDKLFKIDQKTSSSGTEGEPGSGLGLILCKEFLAKLGGNIRLKSQEGHGSTFYFTIPVPETGVNIQHSKTDVN